MIDRTDVEMALELSAFVALVAGVVVFLLCKAAALLTAILAREGGFDPLLRNAYIISAVLLTLDLALLGVLFYNSLPHEPRPLFAEEPSVSPLRQLVPLIVPIAGIVIGLSVTTAVARESPASMKKYLTLLAVASLVLLTVTILFSLDEMMETIG